MTGAAEGASQALGLPNFVRRMSTKAIYLQKFLRPITLVKSSRIYTGQYTFLILLLNDDNMFREQE